MQSHARVVLLLAVLFGAIGLSAVPASAAPTITATTSKGQVSATATGLSADYYYHFVIVAGGGDEPLVVSDSVQADGDGTMSATLLTWGIGGEPQLALLRCANEDCSLGGTAVVAETSFTPVDPGPTVTWDTATVVGPDSPGYSVTIDETDGGGALAAYATDHSEAREAVSGQGTTMLTFPESRNESGTVTLLRCQDDSFQVCTTVVESPEIAIRRSLRAHVYGELLPGEAGPDGFSITMFTDDPGEYTLDWWLEAEGTDTPLAGVGATGVPVTFPTETRQAEVPLSFAGAPSSGPMDLRVRLSRSYPGAGTITGLSEDNLSFTLNALAAGSFRVSPSVFYPRPDGYLDTVAVSARTTEAVVSELQVVSGTGAVVRRYPHARTTSHRFTWDGRTGSGRFADAGRYTFRLRATDWRGDYQYFTVGTVTLSLKRLVTRTFVKTVSAGGSRYAAQVGRCSTLRTPAARGWARSEGLYSATKCRRGAAANTVRAAHRLVVPAAVRYQRLALSVYGGAAKATPASRLHFDLRRRTGHWAGFDTRLPQHVGDHAAGSYAAAPYISDSRRVHWAVSAANGSRYDVKSFTLRLTYQVLG